MASSSKKHDVFLSFRGEDTRENFTSHLHNALIQKKIETYIDYKLKKGDEISGALVRAIEESHVSVVIFSENYASSKWCLDEIAKIIECKKDLGQVVIPVFYKVDPSHVRKQKGSYEKEFEKHEVDLKGKIDRVDNWRKALTVAANLAGWDFQTYRNESEFIKDIVKDVMEKLNAIYPIELLKGLVGIEENFAVVESLMEIESREVRMIGLWGMGGIGKTTLAIAICAKLSSQFEGHCFVGSVRELSEKHGLDFLRKKLFSELLEDENLHSFVPRVESHFVTSRLRRKKVLIVLDDVASSEQLEDLINDYDYLGAGSRVIVTTRDKHIFSHVDGIHEVRELNKRDSLQLFCRKAFGETHPRSGYEELSESVIAYCKGNPLAINVLGARLRSRSMEVWISALKKLEKNPDVKIMNVLKLSYDDLDHIERDIFLDIACFFKGESRDQVMSLMDACEFFAAFGIEVLLDKSLISISKRDTIEMHDLIQEMGWNIVRQESLKDPGRRSRLWDPKEVHDVLKNNRGTEAIEGIILDMSKIEDLHLSYNSLAKMTNIRFLKFYYGLSSGGSNVYLPNTGLGSLPDKLRYLQWQGYCHGSLPSSFSANLLVELSLPYSHLEKLWDGTQNLVNLKEIDLRCSKHLTEIPDLSMATNLEDISLSECESLRHVHQSILSLPKLQNLDLAGCIDIESLQTGEYSKSIATINLSNCSSLKEFSVSSEKLKTLWLDGTAIQQFPSSIWHCENLQYIDLKGCENLSSSTSAVTTTTQSHDLGTGSLSLDNLVLSGCKQLNAMYLSCIFELNATRCLTSLKLENCCNLKTLPDSISLLSSLQYLELSGSNVESLSPNIKSLLNLKELWLDNCKNLRSLDPDQVPPFLRILTGVNCNSFETHHHDVPFPLIIHGLEQRRQSVFLPGDRIPERFSFHSDQQRNNSVVSIPRLWKSGLSGFIFGFVLSKSSSWNGTYDSVGCYIYRFPDRIDLIGATLGNLNLVSDHVYLLYVDITRGGNDSLLRRLEKSGGCDGDFYTNLQVEFYVENEDGELSVEGIKGCGVCPLYHVSKQEFAGKPVVIVELLEPNSISQEEAVVGFGTDDDEGSNHNNHDDQTMINMQQVMHQTKTSGMQNETKVHPDENSSCHALIVSTARGCNRQSFKEEDCHISSTPKYQINITPFDTPRANSNINSNHTIDNPAHHEPDWDPIAELESMLHPSYNQLSPTCTDHSTNIAAILENLETLLETSLEMISSDNEVKQQFHHVLEQLCQFEDQIPVMLDPVISKLKTFIEGVDVRYVSAQNTIKDYDKLLQSRSSLAEKVASVKAREAQIKSKVSQGKIQFEKINSEIFELEEKLRGLKESRDKVKRQLDSCDVENTELKTEVAKWVPQCRTIMTALKKSETAYKMALTNKKKAEDEWDDLKKTFHLCRQ